MMIRVIMLSHEASSAPRFPRLVKGRMLAALLLLSILSARSSDAANFPTEVMDATFKLFHPSSTGTCFLVRREAPDAAIYLITAAHSFERMSGNSATLVLRKAQDRSFERHDYKIPIRRDGSPLWVRHATQDVAVLRLEEPLPVPVTALPSAALADEAMMLSAGVHICSPLFLLTYPERVESNSAGFPIARQGIFASPPLLPVDTNPTFYGDFPAYAGDSGGPVFLPGGEGQRLVVGMVTAKLRHDEKIETQHEERTIHHPLNLGIIVHAHYLRETLELAAAGGAKTTGSEKTGAPAEPAPAPKTQEATNSGASEAESPSE
ncbi:MAG: S1 family peptidase [Chthoniobacteraceae bacterium]